jgi:hypothetical protein
MKPTGKKTISAQQQPEACTADRTQVMSDNQVVRRGLFPTRNLDGVHVTMEDTISRHQPAAGRRPPTLTVCRLPPPKLTKKVMPSAPLRLVRGNGGRGSKLFDFRSVSSLAPDIEVFSLAHYKSLYY